jgi:hypothetical protein
MRFCWKKGGVGWWGGGVGEIRRTNLTKLCLLVIFD